MIPPTRLDDDVLDALVARMRNPDERRGDLRAQLAAHRARGAAARRALRAPRPRPRRRGDGRALRLLGARSCARRSRACRTGASRRPTCSRRATGDLADPRRGDDRRRRDRDRLRRHRAAARREPQLPARGHALGLLLRRPLPDRPRRARLGRRLRAGARDARRRARSSTPARPRPSRPGTSRPRAGIVDVVFAALRPARAGARAGPGDDEQPHARQRPLHLLRDASAAARAPARTPTARRRCTSRCRTR